MEKARQYNYSKRYELSQRQSWIDRDNDIARMNDSYAEKCNCGLCVTRRRPTKEIK